MIISTDYENTLQDTKSWLADNAIQEIECLVPDIAGIARGKILRTERFVAALQSNSLHLAESLYSQDVRGDTVMTSAISPLEPDIVLKADLNTLRLVPWATVPTALVICDAYYHDGKPLQIASRQALHRVVAQYVKDGLNALVCPELEFYLIQPHCDPTNEVSPATVRSGAKEAGKQTYGVDILSDYRELFDDLYRYCDTLNISAEVLTHEAGPGQFEINLHHGDPIKKADEVFLFKRAAKEAALKHGKMITFMAKPVVGEPGNAMHIHQSVYRIDNDDNIFANANGDDSAELLHYVGGLQKYSAATLLMMAPYVNSYRRFVPNQFAPVNTHWSHENRTVGLRIPHSNAQNRRVENRIIGADANPYLATAASLGCGLLGLRGSIAPGKEMTGNAFSSNKRALPEHLLLAIDAMRKCRLLTTLFDTALIKLLTELKYAEYQQFLNTITPWEREHLLHTV